MDAIKAQLLTKIPSERYRSFNGSAPQTGDVVIIDQGFTFPDGNAGCVAYKVDQNGSFMYEAEVYEFELGENMST
ncbi:hypothetical protein MHO82_22745 [Vibrio sp. Of7-15]|uniref:hypothetical protein n=1 Tax=Vibrio sp. Of7-15 TaxID=2724879 RepID=UPI001EF19A03|nr:hypothetical protein [Vibrio sp. Of7-15]MCG7499687.1 hypothetical protein [Vibrio sp. Of7-15]